MDINAPAQACVQRGETVITRPSMARQDSQREARLNRKQYDDHWATGPFADVADKRLGGIGPRLHTEHHEQLTRRMRMEGARVSYELAQARRDNVLANQRHQTVWRKLHEARDEVHELREALRKAEGALRETSVALSEMDSMFAISQQRRRSRRIEPLASHPIHIAEGAQTPELYPERDPA